MIDEAGNIMELAIWAATPDVLYDNHAPKGHHRHIGGIEDLYVFGGVDQLLSDFMADVRRITEREGG